RICPSGDEKPLPERCISRTFVSIRSHVAMSGSLPVNIGVGNSMNICFVDSSACFGLVGISSIETAPRSGRMVSETHHDPRGDIDQAPKLGIWCRRDDASPQNWGIFRLAVEQMTCLR